MGAASSSKPLDLKSGGSPTVDLSLAAMSSVPEHQKGVRDGCKLDKYGSCLPADFIAFQLRHPKKPGLFRKQPRHFEVQVEDGTFAYNATYQLTSGYHLQVNLMSIQHVEESSGYAYASPHLKYVREAAWCTRDAHIFSPGEKLVCKVRKGSTLKFTFQGISYRWQRRPAGNWIFGFPDRATFKLVEMKGRDWVRTVASLHLATKPEYGRAATLYLPAASAVNPEWQGLVMLMGLVVLQEELLARQNSVSGAGAASNAAANTG